MNNRTEANRIARLNDNSSFDTAEEIALLSATAGVINVRPIEADKMLPASDPTLIDLQLGAMLYMKKAVVSFLGGGDPAKYAAEIKFITDRGRVTEANIKDFVKQGIASAVEEEFNKVRFMTDINSSMSYNCILTRSANDQYVLSYESYFGTNTKSKKELSGNSLELFLGALSNSKDFSFTPSAINTVRAQATLIPAVVFDGWEKTTPSMVNPYELLTRALTNFYITPNETNYRVVRGIFARAQLATVTDGDEFTINMRESIARTLTFLNQALYTKINRDINTGSNIIAAADIPREPQYGIFTLNIATGNEIFVSKTKSAPGLLRSGLPAR